MPLNVFVVSATDFFQKKLESFSCSLIGSTQDTAELLELVEEDPSALSLVNVLFIELLPESYQCDLLLVLRLKLEHVVSVVCIVDKEYSQISESVLDSEADGLLLRPLEDVYLKMQLKLFEKTAVDKNSYLASDKNILPNMLLENKLSIQSLLDNLPISVFYKDRNGHYIGCNREFERTHGYSRSEVIGKTIFDLLPEEYAGVSNSADVRLLHFGGSISYEATTRFQDGKNHEVLIHKAAFCDLNGEIIGLVGSIIDISERKVLEQNLADERQLLRSAIDLIPDILYVKNLDGKCILGNRALADLGGLSSVDELIGLTAYDFLDDLEACGASSDRDNLIIEGKKKSFELEEFCSFKEQNKALWLLTKKVPFVDKNGDVKGVVSISHDITSRKKLEDELKELQDIVNESKTVVFLLKAESGWPVEYVTYNVSQFGYHFQDFIEGKMTYLDILDDEAAHDVLTGLADKVSQGLNNVYQEYRIKCKDGSLLWMESHKKVRKDKSGNVTHYQVILTDISDRKAIEKEHEAIQSQIQQSQKLEAVGQLAAGIAHEINTPIQFVGDNTRFFKDIWNDINEFIVAFQEGKSSEELQAYLKEIEIDFLQDEIPQALEQTLEGINRVATIVLAMKDFSHPGQKDKTGVDINKSLSDTITVTRNEWKYSSDLITHFDTSIPHIYAYESHLNQCFLNVIVNAAQSISEKYSDLARNGTIEIRTERDGKYIVVHIRDTGTGIPEEIRKKVFDPFFTTKGVGKGTGQGLALVHDVIVRLHGGKIDLESIQGEGSCFHLYIPIGDRESEER